MNKQELLQKLYAAYANCRKCPLYKNRTNIVFGSGNPESKILFVGEGPGAEEDLQAKPFVGKSGLLLTKCLETVGIERAQVYITNVVKCRPPQNRTPTTDETKTCMGNLLIPQIDIIKPKIVVTVGSCATINVLDVFCKELSNFKITEQRGKIIDLEKFNLMPIFHPAYILRNQKKLPIFINDLEKIRIEQDRL